MISSPENKIAENATKVTASSAAGNYPENGQPSCRLQTGRRKMSIQYETPVGEVASTLPASVRVLERYGIDYCCGGSKPLGAACQEKGVPLDQFLADVETAKQSAGVSRARDWNAASA